MNWPSRKLNTCLDMECVFPLFFGHMYSSVALVQTTDLDLREEMN